MMTQFCISFDFSLIVDGDWRCEHFQCILLHARVCECLKDERSVKILFWWAREGVGWFGLGERSMPFGAFWCEES